jgi:hypothetical protein
MQRGLHATDRGSDQLRNLFERIVEHILQQHARALLRPHDILTVEHRARHARAVAVQTGAGVRDRLEESEVACLEETICALLDICAHTEVYAAGRARDTL